MSLWYNPQYFHQYTGEKMLLEDLKQHLDNIKGRLETLRRHL